MMLQYIVMQMFHNYFFIGIDGNLLSWVTDYLDDKKQKVVLDRFSSGWEGIDAGVPQGSVGPFLSFTITLEIQTQMTVSINICHSVVHIPKIN
jgi:hypothetical protein